jgi:hypothetical protein
MSALSSNTAVEEDLCPTMASLAALGFTARRPEYASVRLAYALTTGEIDAQEMVNLRMVPIVQISGVLRSLRATAMIDLQLLRSLGSPEEAAAWLVFGLQQHRDALVVLPSWWAVGEDNLELHPIVQKRKAAAERALAYGRRPRCEMPVDHARLFRRQLRAAQSELTGPTDVVVRFDGHVLRMTVNDKVISVVADGERWPHDVSFSLSPQTKLPGRFSGASVALGFFDQMLDFERYRYPARETK